MIKDIIIYNDALARGFLSNRSAVMLAIPRKHSQGLSIPIGIEFDSYFNGCALSGGISTLSQLALPDLGDGSARSLPTMCSGPAEAFRGADGY